MRGWKTEGRLFKSRSVREREFKGEEGKLRKGERGECRCNNPIAKEHFGE